ncbi:MAG: sulfotransferase domain-containing protein [Sandaracinaceae bacterium]
MSSSTKPITRIVAFGPQRSGNVLLEHLVGAHPDVCNIPCVDTMLQTAVTAAVGWRAPLAEGMRRYLGHLATRIGEASKRPAPARLDEVRDLDGLHRELARGWAPERRFAYVRMHQPLELLEDIARTEDVRCLCIVRDARDVMLSRVYRGQPSVDRYVEEWRRFARIAARLNDAGHARIVRFEDVLDAPDTVERDLESWLGIRVDLRGRSDAMRWPRHSSFGELPDRVVERAARRWNDRQNEPLVRFVSFACKDELARLGYPAGPSLPIREAVRHARRRTTYVAIARLAQLREAARRRLFPPLIE